MTRSTRPASWRLAVRKATGGPDRTDAELLDRFVSNRDEEAFADLVARHGRLVFGVCRRVLMDRHRAEDAYQAVWLVLARRAADVRPVNRLPAWLHGVAYRTALRARRADTRRRWYERRVEPRVAIPDIVPVNQLELDTELAALPDHLRLPVLLCDLGGQPQREAARHLGLPTMTLANRLKAARERLAVRLTARGLAPAAAVAILEPLPSATAGAPAVRLAEDVLMTLTLAKWKTAVAVLAVAVGVILVGRAGGVSPQTPPDETPAKKPSADGVRSPDRRSFLERVVRDLRGDAPTGVERNYYSADPDAFRDHKVSRWLADDAAVRAHVGRRFGLNVRLGLAPEPERTDGPVKLDVWAAAKKVHTFEWPITEPRKAEAASWSQDKVFRPAYRIEPPDVLHVLALQSEKNTTTLKTTSYAFNVGDRSQGHVVHPGGTIGLGAWGSVSVSGMTIDEAEAAVREALLAKPNLDPVKPIVKDRLRVLVDVLAYNSKAYYVITDFAGTGEQVYRRPVTGSETVLDALSQLPNKVPVGANVYIQREEQTLPVDWVGITQHGQTATNYLLLSGDRVYVLPLDPEKPGEGADDNREFKAKLLRLYLLQKKTAAESDETFLRRLTLAARGTPPTGLEIQYFSADTDPNKRAKLTGWLNPRPVAPAKLTARDRYTLLPPDSISVTVTRADGKPDPTPGLTYSGHLSLTADGQLPEVFGFKRVNVAGLTTAQAAEAIRRSTKEPADADRIRVEVKVIGYNNHRGFELIFDRADGTPHADVRKIAFQGETVYRHLVRNAEGPADYDGKRIWIDRGGKVLPIDWDAITRRRDEGTNYVIEPGDKVFVTGK